MRVSRAIEQVKGPDLTPSTTCSFGGGPWACSAAAVWSSRLRTEAPRPQRAPRSVPGAITDGKSAADHGRVRVFHGTPTPVVEEQWEALDLEGLRVRPRPEASARQADCDALGDHCSRL